MLRAIGKAQIYVVAAEVYGILVDLKGNPQPKRDWPELKSKHGARKYLYTVAHWAATEARFRRHFKKVADASGLEAMEELLMRVLQRDVVRRDVLDSDHFAYVPDFGAYIEVEDADDGLTTFSVSRQIVLFCVERRPSRDHFSGRENVWT